MSDQPGLETFAATLKSTTMRRILLSDTGFELYRAVDNELFLRNGNTGVCLGMASARPREGRTTTALLCAALSAAQAPRRRILLLDASLGDHGVGAQLGIAPGQPGLNDICRNGAPFDACVVTTALPNLHVIGGGDGEGKPRKLLQQEFGAFLAEARKRYQLVVADTPAGSENRDLISMAKLLDHMLMVVRYRYATREQIKPLIGEFASQQVSLLGAVLNRRVFPIPRFFYGR
jgi:Mrp family chromosome partitioning ATPase